MRGQDGYLFQRPQAEAEPVTPEKVLKLIGRLKFGKAKDVKATAVKVDEIKGGGEVTGEIDIKEAEGGDFTWVNAGLV